MATKEKTVVKTEEKKEVIKHSFYGGKVIIEAKPWGDTYRYTIDKRSGILSNTGITKNLDKSKALLPWAIGLVGSHIKSSLEVRTSKTFTKEEIFLLVDEAVLKPDEAKVKGGQTGDAIHDYAHKFAKAVMTKSPLPEIPKELFAKEKDGDAEAIKTLNGINGFLDFYNGHKVEFIAMEKLTYYNSFLAGDTKAGEEVIEFLGIIDLVAKVDGKVGVWDYKTGKAIYSDQRYQLSGYRKSWNANPDNKKVFAVESGILNFNKETGELDLFRCSNEESEKDYKAFLGLHSVALREKELEAEYRNNKKNESK